MLTLLHRYLSDSTFYFGVLTIAILISVASSIWLEDPLLLGGPAVLIMFYLAIVDFKMIFYILIASIPFSIEYFHPSGFGTDLPTEPLTLSLMFIFLFWALSRHKLLKAEYLTHPISLILLLHIGWTYIATLNSNLSIVSIKFSLAKTWYVIVFYFLGMVILKDKKRFDKMIWWITVPLLVTVIIVLVRHAMIDFSFAELYSVLGPFYKNHVIYACLLAVVFPYVVYMLYQQPKYSLSWLFYLIIAIIFLVAIQLSFTRAAYVALIIALAAYIIVRLKWMLPVSLLSIALLIIGVNFLVQDNRFMGFAPDYEKTVTHKSFDNLLEATYKFEDISTMERVYRWVAGARMITDEPFFGFGPGNFYFFYKSYTLSSFRTYVSDNPERSGPHSYFLMIMVEQGYIGVFIFLLFTFFVLVKAERIYHSTKNKSYKQIVAASMCSLVVIDAFLLINDMVETDKVGSFYFINIALIVAVDLMIKEDQKKHMSLEQ